VAGSAHNWTGQAHKLRRALASRSPEVGEIARQFARRLDEIDELCPSSPKDSSALLRREGLLRDVHYALISPLCRITISKIREEVENVHPLIDPATGRLRPQYVENFAHIREPRDRLAYIWTAWRSVFSKAIYALADEVIGCPGGEELSNVGHRAVTSLQEVERHLGTEASHLSSLGADLMSQLMTGSGLRRKFNALVPQLYAEHGISISQKDLQSVLRQSSFGEQSATIDGAQLQTMIRIWSGCEPACYVANPGDEEDFIHSDLLSAYNDAPLFRSAHSFAAWFEPERWALFHPGPMPWPDVDISFELDPALFDTPFWDKPVGRLRTISGRTCPALAFEGIRELHQILDAPVYDELILDYAVQYWLDDIDYRSVTSGFEIRTPKSADQLNPLAASAPVRSPTRGREEVNVGTIELL
jgi:hypothetical protein